jgi:hypothetical protein
MDASIVILVFLSLFSFQPQSSTGTIRGTVTSKATGEPIIRVDVSLYPPPLSTHTDSNGVYRLTKVLPGEYNLTISAPGYAKMTFRGLLVPQYTPLVIDAKLRDAATSSDTVIVVKFSSSSMKQPLMEDKMMFYQPDSTIDYKIRIVNPEATKGGLSPIALPDSSKKHK